MELFRTIFRAERLGTQVTGRGTLAFFDTKAVKNAINAKQRKMLGKFGGYCRKTARHSIKPAQSRRHHSRPGKPPLDHTHILKNGIIYALDTKALSVVIGPAKSRPGHVPYVLEYGGTSVTVGRRGRRRNVTIAARPYMRPALSATLEHLAPILRESGMGT